MSETASNRGDTFDAKRLRRLAELMQDFDLSEIDLTTGDTRIQLRRQREAVAVAAPAVAAPAAATPAPAAAPAAPAAEPADAHTRLIKSPMVGTFYVASGPDTPPFVKVGDHVGQETTVCIVEAMKVFNEIPAEVSGKVVAVLVENGEPVEYGQPLFKIDTRK